jgi:hypothetical protein
VISRRERVDAIEVIAFNPILQLSRLVAGIFANFKHGHDDDLHRNGTRRGAESQRAECGEKGREAAGKSKSVGHREMICKDFEELSKICE